MTPQRIQLRRTKGWRLPKGAVVVSRPSKWGNPFTAAAAIDAGYADTQEEGRKVARDAFHDWLHGDTWAAGSNDEWAVMRLRFLAELSELAGHDLACWCPLDQPCHADVLLELANGATP